MTQRSDPRHYPYPPVNVFDALLATLPDTDYQIVWADRDLGFITAITTQTRWVPSMYLTVALRHAPDGSSVVTVQIASRNTYGLQHTYERRVDFSKVFDLIDQALARVQAMTPPLSPEGSGTAGP